MRSPECLLLLFYKNSFLGFYKQIFEFSVKSFATRLGRGLLLYFNLLLLTSFFFIALSKHIFLRFKMFNLRFQRFIILFRFSNEFHYFNYSSSCFFFAVLQLNNDTCHNYSKYKTCFLQKAKNSQHMFPMKYKGQLTRKLPRNQGTFNRNQQQAHLATKRWPIKKTMKKLFNKCQMKLHQNIMETLN